MINITNPAECCGCTACVSVCSHHAITMIPDKLGFLYPHVDSNLCVDCGLCDKICAFNENYDKSFCLDAPIAYGVRHKDINEIETSRSGAVFIALSDYILDKGGVVYGVGYSDHFRVVHKRATTRVERNEFKGSKYVQSDLTGIFTKVKEDLRKGLYVLFSGTPCQCAGLASFIGKRLRERLYIIDIICHGVPSPYIWRDYLAYQEQKYSLQFTKVNFRDKSNIGWNQHKESLEGPNFYKLCDSYTYLFYQHIMLRHSCEKCPYTNLKRVGDITIADFWGWEKTDKDFNKDNKGCSLALINTLKGVDLFEGVKQSLNIIHAKLEDCLQPNLQHPTPINIQRMIFEYDYAKHGFEYVVKKYGNIGWKYNTNLLLRRIINKIKRTL